nr:hypothetical protein [uncultured Anaerosporobacter sp.]
MVVILFSGVKKIIVVKPWNSAEAMLMSGWKAGKLSLQVHRS